MRKTWVYRRKNLSGWWVGWYEAGRRKSERLPNKALAEHFAQIKYQQFNSDIFTGVISVDWGHWSKNTSDPKESWLSPKKVFTRQCSQ